MAEAVGTNGGQATAAKGGAALVGAAGALSLTREQGAASSGPAVHGQFSTLTEDDTAESESSSDEDEFVEAEGGQVGDESSDEQEQERRRRHPSRAAKIATETMAKEVKTRNKLGKPLASLTQEDVALSDQDVEDVSGASARRGEVIGKS